MPHPTRHPSLPVMIDIATISTPKEQAIIASVGKIDPAIIARATDARIRSLPIVGEDGDCLGAIELQKLAQLAASNTPLRIEHASTRCAMLPHLVPVAAFLATLTQDGIVMHRADPDDDLPPAWFGIVTAADLNRPLFRAHIYQMLVILETSLGQLIMDEFGDDWGAIRLLSEHTQGRIREFYEEEKADGVDLSPVTNATLSDLFHIAIESRNVWQLMGFERPDLLRPIAQQINELRNRIMHPVRPLLVNERELRELSAGVELIESLSAQIAKQIGVVTG